MKQFNQQNLARLHAFTLVELLVVMSLIAMLIALLLPALGKARESARIIQCASNVRGQTLAVISYATDNAQDVPRMEASSTNIFGGQGHGSIASDWQHMYRDYMNGKIEMPITYHWNGHTTDVQWWADTIRFFTIPTMICPSNLRGQVSAGYKTNLDPLPYAYFTGGSADVRVTLESLLVAGTKNRVVSGPVPGDPIPGRLPAIAGDVVNMLSANNGGRTNTNHTQSDRNNPDYAAGVTDPTFRPDGGNVGRVDGSVLWFGFSTTRDGINCYVPPYGGFNGSQTYYPSNMICLTTDNTGMNNNVSTSGNKVNMGGSFQSTIKIFPN